MYSAFLLLEELGEQRTSTFLHKPQGLGYVTSGVQKINMPVSTSLNFLGKDKAELQAKQRKS